MRLKLHRKAYGKPPLLFVIHKGFGDIKVIGFQPKNRFFKKTFSVLEDSIYHIPVKQKAREELAGSPDGYYLPKSLAGKVGEPWGGDIQYLPEHTFLDWSRKCVVI